MVVVVVLLQYGVEVSEVLIIILEAGYDDAEADLLVLAYSVLLLVLELFLKHYLLHPVH